MAKFLFDGMENFFALIKERCADKKEYAAEILKARGFLLEDDGLTLSDNSHRDDAKYLNELLAEDNLGEVRGDKIFISPDANVEKIFYKNSRIGLETLSLWETWERFIHDSYAPKVPLRYLEPFVGRYIKAISACGVATCLSCDGNHFVRGNIHRIVIEFVGGSHFIWHEIIFNNFFTHYFKFLRQRPANYGDLNLYFMKENKWKAYMEFNRAAEFLYDNRIKLRQIRREASDRIGTKLARKLSYEEMHRIFSTHAKELLDKSSFIVRNHFFGGKNFYDDIETQARMQRLSLGRAAARRGVRN